MTEVRFLPPAAKFIKKLKDKKSKSLYQEAVDKIREDHTIGQAKTGGKLSTYFADINELVQEREAYFTPTREIAYGYQRNH